VLFSADAHEPLTERAWDEAAARDAVAAIVEDATRSFDPDALWPPHPLDEVTDDDRLETLYLGAAGVVWALDRLDAGGWAEVAGALPERYAAAYDDDLPSLLIGEAGVLLVAHTLARTADVERRLLDVVRANARNPTRELLWGSPGTMLAAQVLWERTNDDAWAEAWRESADWLWDEWRDELWEQDVFGRERRILGPAHGFAGNVLVLARGDLLDAQRRAELERRTVAAVSHHAVHDGDLAQWSPSVEEEAKPEKWRVQWCHGAPGIVTSLAALAPENAELTQLLVAGGELTWRAGPLVKGPGLCHGTAGNGYAFLKLHERTGDELWLERARRFAMHALEQVEGAREKYGQGRYALLTGDVGAALYVRACVDADAAFPILDVV
jgi:hypothetical protein